jgi:hypothetical protein
VSKRFVLGGVALVIAGWLVGCNYSPDNHVVQPHEGGKPPPPTALKKAGGQEGSTAQQ